MTSSFQEPDLQTLLEKVARDEGFDQPKYEISLGSKPGDNFVGRIYRAVVTEGNTGKQKKPMSLIFKASPTNKKRQEMMSTDEMFRTESEVYQVILPTLNRLINKHGIVDTDIFPGTARCLAAQINESNLDGSHVIVLEDKSVDGFGLFPGKNKILDAEHCRIILKRLALWHAASIALKEEEPETAERIQRLLKKENHPIHNKKHPLLEELTRGSLTTLEMTKGRFKEGNTTYIKAEKLVQNFASELVDVNQPSPDIYCILQGDCWTNNVLFKYNDNGTLEDACLIDLQVGRVASPAVDVTYMLCMCTTKEVREAHYDELVQFYHDELSRNLKSLDCDPNQIFPWDLFQEHLKRHGRNGVLIAMIALPVLAADSSEVKVDPHSNHEGDVFIGCATVTDEKRREEMWQRIADVIDDACRYGYL